MFKRSQLKISHKSKILLFFLGLVVLSVPGFIKSVRAADPPTPGILITSITSSGGTTSNGIHTTPASVANVTGSITPGAVPVATISAYTDYPSASNNLVWTKGASIWHDTVTFTPLSPGASFTVTYIATSEAGITQTISFKITKIAPGGSTVITCTASGFVKKSDGTAVSGASITVASSSQITGNQQTLQTMSSGGYNTSIKANISDWVTATVTYNGANYSAQQYLMTAATCPMTLNITIPVNPGGGAGGGGQVCAAISGTVKLTADTTWSAQTPSHPSTPLSGVVVTITTPGATSVTRSSSPSGSNGSYTINGLNLKAGDAITIKASGTGYTQTGPWTYTVPSDCGTGLLPDVFMYGSKTVSGKVRKKVGNNSDVSFPNIPVALQCDNNYNKSTNSDPAFSQYLFADIPSSTTGCKVSTQVRNSGGDIISAGPIAVDFSKPGPTLLLDTTANLTIKVNFSALYDNFGIVDANSQPDATNPNLVAFPFTITQNGTSRRFTSPYIFSGSSALDSTTPYTIHIDANVGTFGNKVYDSDEQQLKVGENTKVAELLADSPNKLAVDITNVDSSVSSGINVSFTVNDPAAKYKWTCVTGQNSTQGTGATNGTTPTSSTLGLELSLCSRSNVVDSMSTSESGKLIPKNNSNHLVANRFITDKFVDQINSVSFSRYFGETQRITIPYQNINATTYTVRGTVYKGHRYSEGNVKEAYSSVGVSLYLSDKNSNSTSPAVKVCTTTTDNNGEYTCTFTSVQAENKTTLTVSADIPLDSKKTNYAIGRPAYISNFTFITDALGTSCDNNARYLTQASDRINQFWFCGAMAKSLYADPKYKVVWLAMVEEIKKLRNDYSSQAIAPATPPELVINSNMISDANAIFPKGVTLSSSCWPTRTTPDVSGDEARIEINGGLIKSAFSKILSDSAKQLTSKSMIAHEFGHLTDFRKGRCKTYGSTIPGSPIQKLFVNWKTALTKERSARINAILTESNYPGLIGGHPFESETETFASAFDLTNIVPSLLQSNIAAIKSSVSANDAKDKKDLQDLINEVKKK